MTRRQAGAVTRRQAGEEGGEHDCRRHDDERHRIAGRHAEPELLDEAGERERRAYARRDSEAMKRSTGETSLDSDMSGLPSFL